MTEDLNTRVENAAKGISPQTKPDERRRYLGSLRERVLIRMDNTEINQPRLTKLFLEHLPDYQGYTILINGKISADAFISKVEAGCSKSNIPFTLINNETATTKPDGTAILVVAKTAINKMRVEINQVYPPELETKQPEQLTSSTKGGFWHRLFHGGK